MTKSNKAMYISRSNTDQGKKVTLLLLFGRLRALLGLLLLPLNDRLGANAPKNETHAQPLSGGERVTEPEHTQEHGQHLARDGHGHQEQG